MPADAETRVVSDKIMGVAFGIFGCLKPLSDEDMESQERDKEIKSWIKPYQDSIKILLLGAGEAGKTTVLKQMKILHIQGFTQEERLERALQIKKNILEAATVLSFQLSELKLVPGAEAMEASRYLLNLEEVLFDNKFFDTVQVFWDDPVVKRCLKRSNEYQLIDCAEYFLDRIGNVRRDGYVPDDADILQCRQTTTGIQKLEFKVKVPKDMQGGFQEFWMFDVGGQRGERKKWIQVFEGISAVWFLVASSDFDQMLREDSSQNRLEESISIFEDVWQSRFLLDAGLIVFLNKQDMLEKKVNEGRSIGNYFPKYKNFVHDEKSPSNKVDEYTRTKYFIKNMFVEITQKPAMSTSSIPSEIRFQSYRSRECYYHFTTATSTDNIRTVFKDIHNLILKKNLIKIGIF